jgi:hypothetical protein
MTKKPAEPDEMRMPADKFDEMMRRALDAPPPKAKPKGEPRGEKVKKRSDG